MPKWLDLSNNANKLRQTYVTGFVDISGSGLSLRSDATLNLYNHADDTTPKFSMNSDSMRIYDGISSYYDMSNSKLLYLKDLTQDINTELVDLANRTKHITTDTTNIDTMMEFDSSANKIVLFRDVVPATANTYSLGTAEKPFSSLYVNQGTIHFMNPETTRETAAVSFDPLSKSLYLTIDNVQTPLNNTKYADGVLETPLLSYNGNVGIGTMTPQTALDISGDLKINGKTLLQGLVEIVLGDLSMAGNIIANNIHEGGVPLSSKYLSSESPSMTGTATAPSMSISDDLTVGGNTFLYKKLSVFGDASFNGNLIVKTPATNDNSSKAATTAYVQNQGYVNGNNTTLIGTTTITKANVQQKFSAGGDVSLNSKLFVFDNTTLNNNLLVNGATFLNAGLTLTGDASLNGNLVIKTPATTDNSNRVATTAYVQNQGYVSVSNGIFTGSVQMNQGLNILGDVSLAQRLFVHGDTSLNGNVYVAGNLIGKTVSLDNSSTLVATTGFVKGQGYAQVASPTFTGTATFANASVSQKLVATDVSMNGNATAVTQQVSDNSSKVATTAYVKNQGYATLASPNFTGNANFINVNVAQKLVAMDSSMNGNLSVQGNVVLTGTTSAVTPSTNDNSSQVATTAYVQNQGYANVTGATFTGLVTVPNFQANNDVSFNGNVVIQGLTKMVGNVTAPTLLKSDNSDKVATTAYVQSQGYATLSSPVFTGVPTVPTAPIGTSTTTIASTEFVRNEVVSFINSIPSAFDAIQQLSSALSNTDASFATALATEVGQKANIASPIFTGVVQMPQTTITQTLGVLSDVSFNNNMFVAGDTSMNGALNIRTPFLSENSNQAATTAYVKGQGYAQLTGAAFTGDLSTTNNLVVSANTTLSQLVVNSDAQFNANLTVNGNTIFNSAVSLSKGLSVTSDSSFNGNVNVAGFVTTATPTTSDNSLRVATTAYVQNQGYAKLAGSTFQGDVSFNSGIYTSGKTVLNSTLVVVSDASLNSNLVIGGNSTINKKLTVTGDASFNGNVNVGKAIFENGQSLITKYATLASPTFTGTVSGITQSMVGLANVDNTSDVSKPVSTAQQTALNLKANIASPTFTGVTTLPKTVVQQGLSVTGDASLNSNLYVLGNASLNSNLYVNGDVSLNGNVLVNTPVINDNSNKVATTAYVKGQGFALLSGATFTGDVSMNSRLNIGSNLTVSGDVSMNGNVAVQGVTQTLKIQAFGDSSFNANVFVAGDISLNGNLFMNGQSSTTTPATNDNSNKVSTTAYVQNQGYAKLSGDTFTGDVSMNSRLNVLGNSSLNGVITSGDVSMNSRLSVASDVSFGSGLTINKNAVVGGALNVGQGFVLGGDALFAGKLSISGDVSLNANVFVGGILRTSTASTSDNTTRVATTAYVKNQGYAPLQSPTFVGTVAISTANIDQNLIVGSDAYLNANAYITGDATIGGNLTLSGTPSVDDNSSKVATTAYVKSQPFAPLASPTFTGTTTVSQKLVVVGDASINGYVTASTPTNADNSNKVATTAYVKNQGFAPLNNASFTGTTSANLLVVANDISANGNVYAKNLFENGQGLVTKYATLASPTFTGTVSGITQSMVGLANVDNTSDASKPVSTYQQTALNLKANIASPTFTGNSTMNNLSVGGLLIAVNPSVYENSTTVATTAYVQSQGYAQLSGASFSGNVSTTKNLSATGDLSISGNTLLNKNLSITGDVSLNGITVAITPVSNDNSTRVATTAYVQNQSFASLSSPAFTGVPTAPTAVTTVPTSNQIATTLYVENKISDFFNTASASTLNAINQLSSALTNTDLSFSTLLATQLASKANIASPTFTGDSNFGGSVSVGADLSLNGNLWTTGLLYEGGQPLSAIYAPTNSPVFTGTVYGITKSMIGLSNVDNTSDASKPVSTAQQTALNLKANIASPKFTGIVDVSQTLLVHGDISLNGNLFSKGILYENSLPLSTTYATLASPTFTGTVSGITKSMIDLSNVDNTSDVSKPVSTAQQTALNLKANIASPTFTGVTTASGSLIVGGDASFNGNLYGITPATSDNSNRLATTAFINKSFANLSGANFKGDVSMNTNLYVVGDVSMSGNLFVNYRANTIPINAIIGGLGSTVDLSTNQTIGGIKTFVNDVSMQSQLTVGGNASIASNNIVSSLYQTAPAPTATTISNLSKLTNNYNGTFITDFEITKGTGYALEYNVTDGSLNVSNDGGLTWSNVTSTSGNKLGAMLFLSPSGRIRMKQEYSGANATLLYVSTDWGATYTSVTLNKPIVYTNAFYGYNSYNNQSYAFSHDGTVLYFIAHDTNNTMTIWKSTDNTFTNFTNNGLTWNYSLTNCPRAVSTSSDGKYVLTITGIIPANGMYLSLSTNYGASFTRISGTTNTSWNSIAVSYSGQYQVATNGIKIYQSADFGASWLPTAAVPDLAWNFISMSNDGKNRLACVTNGYQYLSLDYGVTWSSIPNSLGNWQKAVMVDVSNNNITAFAHDGVNIYKSFYSTTDILQNTAINTDVNITAPFHYLNTIGKMMKTVKTNYFVNYTGRTPGMSNSGQYILLPVQGQQTIISVDYGQTWNPLNGLSAQTDYNSVAVSGNGQVMYARKGTTTYRSSNYGKSWTAYTTLVVDDRLSGTALSYTGQYIVFAGQDLTTGNSNIYVSSNFGVSWTTAATFPTNSNLFSACMTDSGQYMSMLSTTSYVLVSSDYGVTWTIKYVNALLTSNYMCMSSTGQYQTVVSNTSIFVSSDYGSTFSSTYVSGSPTSNFKKVTMVGTGEYQYAVNAGDGYLYRSTDYGASWSALTTNVNTPSNTIVSSDGKVMLYGVSGDILISRVANYVGSISETALSISRKGFVSALDMTVNGTLSTQALVVNQIYENGNLLASKYAPLVSPTFTGTVSGITAAMVGLGNVNNTSDLLKPVSTATQTALNLKANLASPTFSGLSQMNSVSIAQNAFVGGDMSMNGRLVVGGDISMNGTLYAKYAPNTIPVTAIIGGIPVSTGIFNSDIVGYSRLIVSQDVSLNSRLNVNGESTFFGAVNAESDVSMNANLYVNGGSRFNGDVSANNLITKSLTTATLYSSGDVSLNGNLYVTNSIYEKGSALGAIYAPIESATFAGTTTISKLHVTQEFLHDRDGTIGGNLSVIKDTSVGGNLNVSTAIYENGQSLITKYATLASPTFTGDVSGITKTMVGLSNVDNTSDLLKPISTATQTALNLKADIASPTFTGIPLAPTATAGTNNTQLATTEFVSSAISSIVGPSTGTLTTLQGLASAINYDPSFSTTIGNEIALKAPLASPVFTGRVSLPVTDASSIFVAGISNFIGDVSMNGSLVIKQDLSVNGNITGAFGLHTIPSTAIAFVKNDYSSMTINTQRTDEIEFDDEFFETSMPAGFNGYTEVFYSNHSDLSLNGNLNINGSGPSVIHGDLTLESRLFLASDFSLSSRVNIGGDVSMNNNLDLSGSLHAHSDVTVGGNLKINGSGAFFIQSDVSMNSNMDVSGSLRVHSDTVVYGNLNVNGSGPSVIHGDLTLDSHLYLAKDFSLANRLNIDGDVSMNSNMDLAGSFHAHSDLMVRGIINQQNMLFEEGSIVYSEDPALAIIKAQFVVSNDDVSIGTVGHMIELVGDVSMNSNMDLSGSLRAHSDVMVYGVINQENILYDNSGLIYSEDPAFSVIKSQIAVSNGDVSIGTPGHIVEIVGDISAQGLHVGSNTLLGYNTTSTAITGQNNMVLGNNASPSSSAVSNEITLGNASVTSLRCAANTITALSDARDKKNVEPIPAGLEFIGELNPVKFAWNTRDGSKVDIDEFGFIAQDLLKTQETTGVRVPNLVNTENPDRLEASYGALLPVMIRAIQELKELVAKQQDEITLLKSKLSA